MDLSAYIDVPILVIVYLAIEIIKKLFLKTDKQRGLIPMLAVLFGSLISIIIFYVWPEISTNVSCINAFASGAISGSAATGGNQIYKQISRFFSANDTNNDCNCCNNN